MYFKNAKKDIQHRILVKLWLEIIPYQRHRCDGNISFLHIKNENGHFNAVQTYSYKI